MSVLAHFSELKKRLFRVAIVAGIFVAIAVANFSRIFDVFTADSRALIEAAGGDIIQLTLTEAWVAAAKLAVMVGLTAALPYFLWEMSRFFQPGLKSKERKYIYFLIPGALFSFAVGAAFAYLFLIPRLFEFMLRFQSNLALPQITAASIVSMTVWNNLLARDGLRDSDSDVPAGEDRIYQFTLVEDQAALDDPGRVCVRCHRHTHRPAIASHGCDPGNAVIRDRDAAGAAGRARANRIGRWLRASAGSVHGGC